MRMIEQFRSGMFPSFSTQRGAMIEDGDTRTQPDGDLAAVRRTSRAVRMEKPGRALTVGTESTVIAIEPMVCAFFCVAALAPIAPPG